MDTYTLQINTAGAWRTVCPVEIDRRDSLLLEIAVGGLIQLSPGTKFCLLAGDGKRHWFDFHEITGVASLRGQLGEN